MCDFLFVGKNIAKLIFFSQEKGLNKKNPVVKLFTKVYLLRLADAVRLE